MNVVLGPAAPAVSGSSPGPGAVDESALSAERPFPGLRPFVYADRDYFFGRDTQIYALYRLVEHGRFIAVIGSSGSGKSSLVLAGLCRLLAEESEDAGGPHWAYLDMRPGASPLSRLAKTLARLAGGGPIPRLLFRLVPMAVAPVHDVPDAADRRLVIQRVFSDLPRTLAGVMAPMFTFTSAGRV